jgi:hypothetical protein
MFKRFSLGIFLLAFTVIFSSCNKNDDSPELEKMDVSIRVNERPILANSAQYAFPNEDSLLIITEIDTTYNFPVTYFNKSVKAQISGNGTRQLLTFAFPNSEGNFTIDSSSKYNFVTYTERRVIDGVSYRGIWTTRKNGSNGTIAINKLTSNHLTGSITATLKADPSNTGPDTADLIITNGNFDIIK